MNKPHIKQTISLQQRYMCIMTLMRRCVFAGTLASIMMMMIFWCFTSLSTIFKSYRDDEGVIINRSVQSSAIKSRVELQPLA